MILILIKEEEVGGQCSGGEGEEAVAKKFVQIIHNLNQMIASITEVFILSVLCDSMK